MPLLNRWEESIAGEVRRIYAKTTNGEEEGIGKREEEKPLRRDCSSFDVLLFPFPSSLLSAHLLPLRRSLRTVVPVLHRADAGHAPLVPVPAVEAFPLERPESAIQLPDHD